MSWSTAQLQCVSIVKAVTPTMVTRSFGRNFVHAPKADAGDPSILPDTRGFWFELEALATKHRYSTAPSTWTIATADLVVVYRDDKDHARMNEALATDYQQLAAALLDPSNWARSTSKIQNIGSTGGGDGPLLPAVIEDRDGARLMRLALSIEYLT